MTDFDPAFVQQVFDIPERKRKTNVEHHSEADDLGAGFKVAKGRAFCHSRRLGRCAARLKRVLSDSALSTDPADLSTILQNLGLTAQVRLRLGDEVVIWPATVDRLSDEIDQRTGTVGVVAVIDGAYDQVGGGNRPPLTKGMFVEVRLSATPIEGILLPRSALRDGQVFTADADNRLRIVAATPRLTQGEIALFNEGIAEGTRVVLAPPSPVIEGQLLDLHPDDGLMAGLLLMDDAQ